MIITRTPFRISFAGGMSDIPAYYEKDYGCVVSATINKYIYIIVNKHFNPYYRIKYSKTENVDTIDEIDHPLVRECLKFMNIKDYLEIAALNDIPSRTGLGSSSAFVVGLLHALHIYKGDIFTKKQLADEASHIEIDILKNPIGKQDQYASALGGINYIKFTKDNIEVIPLKLPEEVKNNLNLLYIGRRNQNPQIHENLSMNMESHRETIDKIRDIADIFKKDIEDNLILNTFGLWLSSGWNLKQGINGITTPEITYLYKKVLEAGADGAKLLGEGGNGFILTYSRENILEKLNEKVINIPFSLDYEGSKVIYEY